MSFLVAPFTYLSYLTTPMAVLSGTTVLGITPYPLHPVESAVSLILTPFPSFQRRSKYYLRLGTYLGCMVAVAYCAMFAAAGMSLIGMRFDVQWVVARSFYGVVSWVMGLKIEFVKDKDGKTGEEYLATKPAVLMMNHQSVFDIYFVGKYVAVFSPAIACLLIIPPRLMPRRSSIMSKSSLKFSPLGPFMLLSGTIFIDRSKASSAIQSIQAAGRQMVRLGLGLWMFPEGTRHSSEKGEMLPFKKGGFHLAIESGIPVVPIVAENYWWAFRGGVFETGVLKVKGMCYLSSLKDLASHDCLQCFHQFRQPI